MHKNEIRSITNSGRVRSVEERPGRFNTDAYLIQSSYVRSKQETVL